MCAKSFLLPRLTDGLGLTHVNSPTIVKETCYVHEGPL